MRWLPTSRFCGWAVTNSIELPRARRFGNWCHRTWPAQRFSFVLQEVRSCCRKNVTFVHYTDSKRPGFEARTANALCARSGRASLLEETPRPRFALFIEGKCNLLT